MREGWVYILADRYRGTLYIGVTADMSRRAVQHRSDLGSRFVRKYGLHKLVYMEHHERIDDAIARGKALKKWRRAWKIELTESSNPDWLDLFETLNA